MVDFFNDFFFHREVFQIVREPHFWLKMYVSYIHNSFKLLADKVTLLEKIFHQEYRSQIQALLKLLFLIICSILRDSLLSKLMAS